jgi:HD-GYP domain-containing protein (c-di-GMP phosphodiesterase class II)
MSDEGEMQENAAPDDAAALLARIHRPVVLPQELSGQRAPCDIFSARGTLMVKGGSVIPLRLQDPLQPLRIFCEAKEADRISDLDPFRELKRVSVALSKISERIARSESVSSGELSALARQVFELWFLDADACLGYARLAKFGQPSVCHVIHVALIAAELASASGFQRDMVESVIGAALTMNLAKLALHDEMFNLNGAPSDAMREDMHTHPTQGVELLRRIGEFGEQWFDAVGYHHENIDGSGYPEGLKGTAIPLPARMVRIADTLAARLTGRKARTPQHWNIHHARDVHHLVTHVFGSDLERLDSPLAHGLLRVLNRFPPGSLMRLSSNELAVVTRRVPDQATPRQAFAVTDVHGRPLEIPRLRHLAARRCEIRGYAHDAPPKLPDVDWRKAWGYGW